MPGATISSSASTFLDDLSSLKTHIQPNEALYILLRRADSLSSPDKSLVAITYVPNAAPVRQKMLFASTRLTLVRELGGEHFPRAYSQLRRMNSQPAVGKSTSSTRNPATHSQPKSNPCKTSKTRKRSSRAAHAANRSPKAAVSQSAPTTQSPAHCRASDKAATTWCSCAWTHPPRRCASCPRPRPPLAQSPAPSTPRSRGTRSIVTTTQTRASCSSARVRARRRSRRGCCMRRVGGMLSVSHRTRAG